MTTAPLVAIAAALLLSGCDSWIFMDQRDRALAQTRLALDVIDKQQALIRKLQAECAVAQKPFVGPPEPPLIIRNNVPYMKEAT
jgi:hypothetical protein